MSVPGDDRGLTLGDGLFETLLWSGGRPVLFDEHHARLVRGCAVVDLPAPEREKVWAATVAAVRGSDLTDKRAAVRLTWTAGSAGRGLDRPKTLSPRLLASAVRSPRPVGPARLHTASVRRNEGSPASRVKSLSYLDGVLARREAQLSGADEAVMLNGEGHVACAAAANLFWFEKDALCTPAMECGALDGIVRAEVVAVARRLGMSVRETRTPRSDLSAAAGMFLTNSLIGLRPVSVLDGAEVAPHPGLGRLAQATAVRIV
jgi:branched-chain amino acid aminotransferase/4-amino-4-deoxychorismate lyase